MERKDSTTDNEQELAQNKSIVQQKSHKQHLNLKPEQLIAQRSIKIHFGCSKTHLKIHSPPHCSAFIEGSTDRY
jgi:hypothetical protein